MSNCCRSKNIINTELISSTVYENSENLKLTSPDHWTLDMIKFYNDDWGNEEHFVVEKIQEKMDKTPSLWEISRKDLLFMHNKIKRSNIKCWNCCQRGHHVAYCPDPPHVPKCHMCGTPGHLENTCPNSKCLNCGNPSTKYVTSCFKCIYQSNQVCSRCQLIGHNFINCSDHWRLYHWTTDSSSIKIPNKNINKPIKDMWCCNCGKKGHFQAQCLCRKNCGGFGDTHPFVISYQKAFNDNFYKDISSKKNKYGKKEAFMRINPMNRLIKKNKLKKKFKRFKRKNKKKKENQP